MCNFRGITLFCCLFLAGCMASGNVVSSLPSLNEKVENSKNNVNKNISENPNENNQNYQETENSNHPVEPSNIPEKLPLSIPENNTVLVMDNFVENSVINKPVSAFGNGSKEYAFGEYFLRKTTKKVYPVLFEISKNGDEIIASVDNKTFESSDIVVGDNGEMKIEFSLKDCDDNCENFKVLFGANHADDSVVFDYGIFQYGNIINNNTVNENFTYVALYGADENVINSKPNIDEELEFVGKTFAIKNVEDENVNLSGDVSLTVNFNDDNFNGRVNLDFENWHDVSFNYVQDYDVSNIAFVSDISVSGGVDYTNAVGNLSMKLAGDSSEMKAGAIYQLKDIKEDDKDVIITGGFTANRI